MLDPRTSLGGSVSAIGFRLGVGRLDAPAVPCAQDLRSYRGPYHPPARAGAPLPWTADIDSLTDPAAFHAVAPVAIA